jgi:hypothetical protein
MSLDTQKILVLSKTELQDLESYCKLNNLEVDLVIKNSYLQGFRIEKYGLLGASSEVKEKIVEVIKEKLVEVPVEVIVEKQVIEYVEVEKEIIKEIPREVIVEKIVEVVKEIPVEKVVEKTVEVVKEIPVDRVVVQEVIKEVPVEKVVTRTEYITDESKVAELVQELERLRNLPPTIVDREVIKEIEVPVEVVREVEVIKEVTVEVPVEVVREVLVEKQNSEDTQRLQDTLAKIRQQNIDKDVKIKALEEEIATLKGLQQQQKAVYLKGSNLDDKLYR